MTTPVSTLCFLAMPVSWKGTLQQYVGRLHRLHNGKKEVRVYDYVDPLVPMLARMYKKRLAGYAAIGYAATGGSVPAQASSVSAPVAAETDTFRNGGKENF